MNNDIISIQEHLKGGFIMKKIIYWNSDIDPNDPEMILLTLYRSMEFVNYSFGKKTYKKLRKQLKSIIKGIRKGKYEYG